MGPGSSRRAAPAAHGAALRARAWWLAIPLLAILYFAGLSAAGLLGPDEPRYASIGREMARSGDWITPRLWGAPWFEKPALLYWMTGAAFRLGVGEDLAPRIPVALMSVAFLILFQWILNRQFGARAAWAATLILGTSVAWLGCSFIGTTDLPMAAAFAAAMLLSLDWIETGDRRRLPLAAALLGVAALAKGLVPLALTLPLLWCGRRRWRDLLRLSVAGTFLTVALPWYLLCYLRNGAVFLRTFFWEQHFARYTTASLAHGQPFWFYAPVLAAALMPWTPAFLLLARRALYRDARRQFLLLWMLFVLVFFSFSKNKLPGYLLPLAPPAAALMGIALAEAGRARWVLPAAAVCLTAIPVALPILPRALAAGLSRAPLPAVQWMWLLPAALALGIYWLERRGRRAWALATMAVAIALGLGVLKSIDLPAIDRAYSARPLWREIAARRDGVCVESMHRSWRYGLNYYSEMPLPDCSQAARPWQVRQEPGRPPVVRAANSAP
ncbi:MAG: glycosyltransferase family 39 protein [Bryobacteraceae bacterium]|jgi:4-amino-4-deoxy-L-arabinose transferase-like glycosyltransferase